MKKISIFKKNRKAMLESLVIFLAFLIVALTIFMFYFLTDLKNAKTVDDVQNEIGDNLFLVGVLRSQLSFEGNQVSLSDLISRYVIEGNKDKDYVSAIRTKINGMIREMYGKDICWKMSIIQGNPSIHFDPNIPPPTESLAGYLPTENLLGYIDSGINDCQLLSKEDDISAIVVSPGYDEKTFEVRFDTKK